MEEKNSLLEFTYGWPAEAAAIPKLNARLEAELARDRKEAMATAREDKQARGSDAPYSSHDFTKVWETYGRSPRLLSLAAEISSFTGGAHGNSAYDALLWERQKDAPVKFAALFGDAKAALAAMTPVYCEELDRQRAEKREGADMSGDEWMTQCPAMTEQVIAPVDANKDGRFELLRVLIAPYEAGPYVEGTYEIDVPVTDAIRKLLKPDYADAF